MRVDVGNSGVRLTWPPRGVEVVDITVCGVEEVEDVQRELEVLREPISSLQIHQTRRLRLDRVVFNQGALTEVAPAKASERAVVPIDRRARGDDRAHGFGHIRTDRIERGQPRPRPGQVAIQHQPLHRAVVVGPFHATPGARSARLRGPIVTGKDQFRVEPKHPQGYGALQMRNRHGPNTDLGAFRAD